MYTDANTPTYSAAPLAQTEHHVAEAYESRANGKFLATELGGLRTEAPGPKHFPRNASTIKQYVVTDGGMFFRPPTNSQPVPRVYA